MCISLCPKKLLMERICNPVYNLQRVVILLVVPNFKVDHIATVSLLLAMFV